VEEGRRKDRGGGGSASRRGKMRVAFGAPRREGNGGNRQTVWRADLALDTRLLVHRLDDRLDDVVELRHLIAEVVRAG